MSDTAPLTILGSTDAAACEGDACLIPESPAGQVIVDGCQDEDPV